MYINKIEELLGSIVDDFYNKVIVGKDVAKFFGESNFVKFQLDINKMFKAYINNINKAEIDDILKNETNTGKIIEIIKKYIAYYTLLILGYFYKGKNETFINNVIEFTKNQPGFDFRIENFFNSDSNSKVIELFLFIQNINTLITAEPHKYKQLAVKEEYASTVKFIELLGPEIINSFKLDNKKESAHNIIKTIILLELYDAHDKTDVHNFIEESTKAEGEFIYIDIVLPKAEYIDYNMIEMSLSKEDAENGFASEIYDLIMDYENMEILKRESSDDIVVKLLESRIVVPITEDFLVYHKDSEKYEKQQVSAKAKKRDDTRIKYIVNKLDSVTEYFSKSIRENETARKELENVFYGPMAERRTVLINNTEDLIILDKMEIQGRKFMENNEYYNDFVFYRQYPYINFKDFQKYGFHIIVPSTIDAIRSINFEKVNSANKNRPLQFRVNNAGQTTNVVGFIVPSKKYDLKCLKLKNLIDVRKIKYNGKEIEKENGYADTVKFIKRTLFESKKTRPAVYWLFDLEKDTMVANEYMVVGKNDVSEQTKQVAIQLYREILATIDNYIIQSVDNSKKEITLQVFDKFVKKIKKNIIDFSLKPALLEHVYYEKIVTALDTYDKKEDEFPGLIGDIISLPKVNPKDTGKIQKITITKYDKLKKVDATSDVMEAELYGAICQHNITWDNLNALRRKNPGQFDQLLFEFFMQYIEKTAEGDFYCKSCSAEINLRNYVLDGAYDDGGNFVSFTSPMGINLEDNIEYDKFRATIKQLEKLIDRLAYVSNINTLTGTSQTIRIRVTRMVKDSIDLIRNHNMNIKGFVKERNEKIQALYGLNKDITTLFSFELDNNIFIYSTKDKDKDKFKILKRNNVLTYLLFLIILELSDTQLLYMTGDKICNYYMFSKYGMNWFNDIKIIKNNKGSTDFILNYKPLCYIIYYMSCMVTKYNLWIRESDDIDVNSTKKFDPNVQKSIIHTLVDLINNIVEVYNKKKKHYIYDIVVNKFFKGLASTFKNEEILNKIRDIEAKKSGVDTKKSGNSGKGAYVKLLNEYVANDTFEIPTWTKCKPAKSFPLKKVSTIPTMMSISHLTNCEEGTFHKWVIDKDKYVCNICKIHQKDIDSSDKMTEKILENYKKLEFAIMNNKYVLVPKKSKPAKKQIVVTETETEIDTSSNDPKNIINDIKSQYGKSKRHKEDYFNFVDQFITKLEAMVGSETNINSKDIYLRQDVYIIDHDHNGYPIEKPTKILDDGTKILYKKNHTFFKRNTLYYINNKLQVEVYYDALTKILLGYREKNKDFHVAKKHNVHLKSNKSILSLLKDMGYPSKYIDISKQVEDYGQIFEKDAILHVISDISRNRINNLKKLVVDIQKFIFRIAYNYEKPLFAQETNPDVFIEKYKNKLHNITLNDFLKNWEIVRDNIFFEDIGSKQLNISAESRHVISYDVAEYDYSGNILLYYIINEFDKLLDMNTDKFVKTTLVYLIADIILRETLEFSIEDELTSIEIQRFRYLISTNDENRQIENSSGETEGFYQELADPDAEIDPETAEQLEDDKEELDALDIEEGGFEYENDS